MEQDRQQADISTPELDGEAVAVPKQPKKRFIGRRAAAEKAAAKGDTIGGIEDSGAIQGSHLVLTCHLD
jgi:2-(3-amino-3-carboxypropyl)histidine synthase